MMIQVNFTEMGLKNFGPYTEEMKIPFESDKLILIHGPNGIGKTMLLDCLPFTLYGITSKGMKGDDVVNNIINKNCHTWVKFNIDGIDYKVDRYQKSSRHGGNTVRFYKGDMTNPILNGHREVLPMIEKLIAPWKLFSNTLMFGQKVKDFFTDLTDSDKRTIFRKLQNLDIYQVYYDETNKRISLLSQETTSIENDLLVKNKLIEDANKQIEIFEHQKISYYESKQKWLEEILIGIDKLKNELSINQKSLKEFENVDINLNDLTNSYNEINNSITQLEKEIQGLENSIDSKKQLKKSEVKESANKEYNTKIKEIEDEVISIIDKLEVTHNELKSVREKLNSEEREIEKVIISERNTVDSYIRDKNLIIDNVLKNEMSICPTCNQQVTDEYKEDLQKKVNDYSSQIKECDEIIIKLSLKRQNLIDNDIHSNETESKKVINEISNNKQKLKLTKDKIHQDIEKRVLEVFSKIDELAKIEFGKISEEQIKSKIEINNTKNELSKEIGYIKQKIEEKKVIENRILTFNEKINQLIKNYEEKKLEEYDEENINSYKNRIKNFKIEIIKLLEKRDSLDRRLIILSLLKKAYSSTGIPAMLIDESIPYMNERVAYYLDQMSNGRYIVSFDTLSENKAKEFKDKISVNVYDNVTHANSRVQFSGGQVRLVDIATILTLGDLQKRQKGISFNIMLLDEVFDSLDSGNIELVSKVLKRISKGKCIVVISHKHIDEIEADEVLSLN